MAKFYSKGNGKGRGKRKSKYTEVEKMAFQFGQVQRGLKNPDSRITESFNNGLKGKDKKSKKSLF